jgi:L,D-transpeptidase ErfK/SrfK
MMKKIQRYFLAISLFFYMITSYGLTFNLLDGEDMVGETKTIRLGTGQALTDVARQYDVGYYELLEANPKLNPYYLPSGIPIVIPAQYVLPNVPHEGIVINLAELRLYYFPPNTQTVVTYPIGIGRQGWDTPTGTFKIIEKTKDPVWHVPASIAQDMLQYGTVLPKEVAAGPDNPLGQYALRLSIPSYLLHGTNVPSSVGRRLSSGCIRMYPEDIEALFNQVSVDTPVRIINQPYKIGMQNTVLMMESHQPLSEMRRNYGSEIQSVWVDAIDNFIGNQAYPILVDWAQVNSVAKKENGLPEQIGYRTT